MALMADPSVPSHEHQSKSWAVPGAFPIEAPGLPQYYEYDHFRQEKGVAGKHAGSSHHDSSNNNSNNNKVKSSTFSSSTQQQQQQQQEKTPLTADTSQEMEWLQWLQRLDELEAQSGRQADPEPGRKPPVVYGKVLTQRQRDLMDEAEMLDILERGELYGCV